MRLLAPALLGLLSVSALAQAPASAPAVVPAPQGQGSAEAILKTMRDKARGELVGKWLGGNGDITEFTVSGIFKITNNPAKPLPPGLPPVIQGTFVLTEDLHLKLMVENRAPLVYEFKIDGDRLAMKNSKGEPMRLLRVESQAVATVVLEDLRQIDAAMDQWAIEGGKKAGDRPTPEQLSKYLHKGGRLYNTFLDPAGPKDVLGNPLGPFILDTLPKVNPATAKALEKVVPKAFWEKYID